MIAKIKNKISRIRLTLYVPKLKFAGKRWNRRSAIEKVAALSIMAFLAGGYIIAHADKIYLKDGRIIETPDCWEEDGKIVYDKFGAIIAIDKNNVLKVVHDTWSDLGQKHFDKGEYKKAADCFTKAIHEDPDNPKLYLERRKCWHELNKPAAEINDLKKVLAIDPNNQSLKAELKILQENEKARKELEDSLLKSKIESAQANGSKENREEKSRQTSANQMRPNDRMHQPYTGYNTRPNYERPIPPPKKPVRVEVRCKTCRGTGRQKSWRWGKSFEGHDSYGNPIYMQKQVPATKRCIICNGLGYRYETRFH